MEANGEVGKIYISKITYTLVREKYNCLPRAQLYVKGSLNTVSYTHLRAHETVLDLVCRLLLEKKKKKKKLIHTIMNTIRSMSTHQKDTTINHD